MSIALSPKHGLNPSLGVCFYCGKDDGTIVLTGRHQKRSKGPHGETIVEENDTQAPHRAVWSKEPCPTCKDWMKQGVILVEVDEKLSKDPQNPYRLGGFVVLKDEAIRRIVKPKELADDILKRRMAFVPHDAWVMLGLPMKEEQ